MQADVLPLSHCRVPAEPLDPGDVVPMPRARVDGAGGTLSVAVPRILLTATLRWPIAARLAIAFGNLGCRVEVACPRGHPATHTRAVRRVHVYATVRPLESLREAIAAASPDLVIPCDDSAAVHLAELHRQSVLPGAGNDAMCALLLRSLGDPQACALATARGRFMQLAAGEGVRVPPTDIVNSANDLLALLAQRPMPQVLKIDSTWGGLGVAIVRNRDEARRLFDQMASRPRLRTALVRMLLDRDPSHLLSCLKAAPRTVTMQAFVPGTPANRAVACWQGQVLAGISVAAVRTRDRTGPATVVEVIDNAEMAEAARRLVKRLGLSGLWGIDFVLDATTGAAYTIEMNPRATPICHLPLGPGRDLVAALVTRLTGVAPALPTRPIAHERIAMFPGEWERDPASLHLQADHHDVPWDEPALVRDGIDRPWCERGLLARLWGRLRPLLRAASRRGSAVGPATPMPVCVSEQTLPQARTTTDSSSLSRPTGPST